MPAPRAKKKLLADLKSSILRPALTSTYKVWFQPNENVQNWLRGKAAAGLGNYVGTPTDDLISLSCSDANLPGSSLATHELNDEFHGVTHRHVYRRQYDTTTDFTFYVDVDYEPLFFFENWMAYTVDEQFAGGLDSRTYSYRVSLPYEYLSDVYISKFERDYKGKILVYKFIGAFPTSFSSMPVSYESSQLLKCTVSMAYQRYVLKSDYFSGSDIIDSQTNFERNLENRATTPVNGTTRQGLSGAGTLRENAGITLGENSTILGDTFFNT